MKSNRIANAIAATLLTFAAGAAIADTNSLTVSAAVSGVCKFNSGTSTLAFGTIDPSGAANATASSNVLYRCTKGTTAAVSNAITGARSMAGSGTAAGETLAYALAFTSGASEVGTGFGAGGSDLTLVLGGTITPAQYQAVKAGPYAETVTLTVTP